MSLAMIVLDPVAQKFFAWLAMQPLVTALVVAQVLDVVSGCLAAFITRSLNSSVSLKGGAKKALMWVLVGLAMVMDPLTPDLPEVKIACGYFLLAEGWSILENAAKAGVPIPKVLFDSMDKLKAETITVVPTAGRVQIQEANFVHVAPPAAAVIAGVTGEVVDPITGPKEPTA